jgi:hypothetical protein
MKILHNVSCKLVMIAVACSLAASTTTQAAREVKASSAFAPSADNARLLISRSADFGTIDYVHLFIDGVKVANLGINETYETALPPGEHVLSISTSPRVDETQSPQRVNLEAGKTYTFTAVWEDPERASLSLETSPGTEEATAFAAQAR